MKEWDKLSRDAEPRFRRILQQLALGNVNDLQWTKMVLDQRLRPRFGNIKEVWSIRASKDLRLITTKPNGECMILGFTRRDDAQYYKGHSQR